MFARTPAVNRALRGERALCCGHEYVVARVRDRGAVRSMKPRMFHHPCRAPVAADRQPDCSRGRNGFRAARVRAHLVDVASDVNRGPPGQAAVRRSRDPADMDIGEEYGSI